MPLSFLAEPVTSISGIGISDLVSQLTDVVVQVAGLIVTFPLNIFLASSIVFMGVGLFKKLKH